MNPDDMLALRDNLLGAHKDVSARYADLIDATEIAKDYAVALTGAQQAHEEARAAIILQHNDDPKALGTNEAAREATIEGLTADTKNDLQDAERSDFDTRHRVSIAALKLEAAKATLRVYESIAALVATTTTGER